MSNCVFIIFTFMVYPLALAQPQSLGYAEGIRLHNGMFASIRVPDTAVLSGDSIQVTITLVNKSQDTLILSDEEYNLQVAHTTVDAARSEVSINWMRDDLRPEYGLPPLQAIEPDGKRVATIAILAPSVANTGHGYAFTLNLGFLRYDPMLIPLTGKHPKTHFVHPSTYSHLTSLHEVMMVGPAWVEIRSRR